MEISKITFDGKKGIEKGYANRTLHVDLDKNTIEIKPVTDEMKEKFVGGKGFDLWLMWNALPKDRVVNWDDPENAICIASGPLGGNNFYPGSGKSIVTTISPLTGMVIDSNVGGYFGPYLKFSGFDAMLIQGKATEDVVIFINSDENTVSIEKAGDLPIYSHELTQELTRRYAAANTPRELQRVSVVSTGPGAEYTRWGCLNFSFYSRKRKWASCKQAGRGGIGTVFRNKKIKAIVCRGPPFDGKVNCPANPSDAREIGKLHNKEIIELDPKQNEMRRIGTGYLPELMNRFDLLPVKNFKFGAHPTLNGDEFPFKREVWRELLEDGKGSDGCWYGCSVSCSHYSRNHVVKTGPFKGQTVIVDGPEYETIAGCGSNWDSWDPSWVNEVNFYCDTYGLDTISVGTGIAFVMECFEAGIIDENITGGLDLSFGQVENAMELIHQMARGEGFGVIVGQGIRRMKEKFIAELGADPDFLHDIGMEHKGLEFSEYMTKESLAQQGGYGLTLKGPQHDEAWLIFEDLVRNSMPSFTDKAKALTWFPFWRTWFGLCGLCKLPWNDVVPADNGEYPVNDPETGDLLRATIPKHVEWYARYFSAITGKQAKPADLIKMSERVYNFQRIFNIRQGKGLREQDSRLPYRAMGPVTEEEYESRKDRYDPMVEEIIGKPLDGMPVQERIKILREHREKRYAMLQDAVYKQRGWTPKGCPSIEKVRELGIDFDDVIEIIKPYQ